MKKLIYLLSIGFVLSISSSPIIAFEINEEWNADYTPKLVVKCSNLDRLCLDLCNHEFICEVPQKVCKDCIGTSILMTNIFDLMGMGYRNTGGEITDFEFIEFIKTGNFVTFTSKSIYNQTDSYDSTVMKARFKGLCPTNIEYPVVFFQLKSKSSVLDKVKYVACGNDVFAMTSTPDIISDLNPLMLNLRLHFY